MLLKLFGVRVHLHHRERLRSFRSGKLLVSNHVSYVDVLVISSLLPSVFVTSVELGDTVVLGLLARLGGSVFIERRKAISLKKEIPAIARLLSAGLPLVLFPEGTTSNGDRVHSFRNAVFEAALVAGCDIMPICLRYSRINGQRITPENRDSLYYYGGASFFPHLMRFLTIRSVQVDVTLLAPVHIRGRHSRRELAIEAHDAISAAYNV